MRAIFNGKNFEFSKTRFYHLIPETLENVLGPGTKNFGIFEERFPQGSIERPLKCLLLARENELKELKEEHDGLEAASSDQVEVAAKFQKMALSMEEDIEAQKDEIQILHAAIEEHKEELTRQVAENDVLKEKEIILQNQLQKQTQDLKNQQTEIEVRFSQFHSIFEKKIFLPLF